MKYRIRGGDDWGSGAFDAPRKRGNKRYKHKGVDLVIAKASAVRALRGGVVSKIGFPYRPNDPEKGHFRYVEVAVGKHRHRYMYCGPSVAPGDVIEQGQVIGHAQGIADLYPGMTDHVHFEIKLLDGSVIDPTNMVTSTVFSLGAEAYFSGRVIMIKRLSDGGYFSTSETTLDSAKRMVRREAALNPDFGVKPDDVDWTAVEINVNV